MSALLEDAIKDLLEQGTNPINIFFATAHYLDIHAGPYEMVIHRTGPYVKGTQVCIRCGKTLVSDGSGGFIEDQFVGEVWRWGVPAASSLGQPVLMRLDESQVKPEALPSQRHCVERLV
jgi:hypothetical protein